MLRTILSRSNTCELIVGSVNLCVIRLYSSTVYRSRHLKSPQITAAIAIEAGTPIIAVKLQAETYELNVFLNVNDADLLLNADLPVAPDNRSLSAGESCGAPAHWSQDSNGTMAIVMGFDDTTWDFGVCMPCNTFDTIKESVRELRPELDSVG